MSSNREQEVIGRLVRMWKVEVALVGVIMFLVAIVLLRSVGMFYASPWLYLLASVFATMCGVLYSTSRLQGRFAGFMYIAAATITLAFFAVTYPNGLIAAGWTAFYAFWYLGFAVMATVVTVFLLPYLARLSWWESRHAGSGLVHRTLFRFGDYLLGLVDPIVHRLVRYVLALEFHVVNQYARMHRSSDLTRQNMFFAHIKELVRKTAHRNGLIVREGEVLWGEP